MTMPPETLKILLVEDNRLNQMVACGLLEKRGHQVEVADNGRQALEKLADNGFDLVLMDIQMPEMDGIEATRRIRAGAPGIDPLVPVIALTAHAMPGDRQRYLKAGMDAYIPKPIEKETFLATVENMGAQAPDPEIEAHLDPAPLKELRQLEEGGFFSLRDYVDTFISDGKNRLEALAVALKAGDDTTFEREAHTLKGSARELGATHLADICERLEEIGSQKALNQNQAQCEAEIQTAWREFDACCRTLLQELENS
jgi:two-component system, sensor histidine kinase and response regulator